MIHIFSLQSEVYTNPITLKTLGTAILQQLNEHTTNLAEAVCLIRLLVHWKLYLSRFDKKSWSNTKSMGMNLMQMTIILQWSPTIPNIWNADNSFWRTFCSGSTVRITFPLIAMQITTEMQTPTTLWRTGFLVPLVPSLYKKRSFKNV